MRRHLLVAMIKTLKSNGFIELFRPFYGSLFCVIIYTCIYASLHTNSMQSIFFQEQNQSHVISPHRTPSRPPSLFPAAHITVKDSSFHPHTRTDTSHHLRFTLLFQKHCHCYHQHQGPLFLLHRQEAPARHEKETYHQLKIPSSIPKSKHIGIKFWKVLINLQPRNSCNTLTHLYHSE